MNSGARLVSRRLPVLPLRRTLDKYLTSLIPFLREDESRGGPSYEAEFDRRVQWAKEFECGIGQILQERLLALDRASPHNWLDDNFWMKSAYLESRSSLIINSNWWCAYQCDPTVPSSLHLEHGRFTFWQVRRAAWLVYKMLQYRHDLESKAQQTAPNLNIEDIPFQPPFHRCRIPMEMCDILAPLPSRGSAESKKILLMLRDWCYAVTVLDDSNTPLPVSVIEAHLWNAIRDVNVRQKRAETAVPIGVLTAHDRNSWANTREYLLRLSPRNREIFNTIEKSLFALSLDDYTQTSYRSEIRNGFKEDNLDAHIRNTSSGIGGRNRWFDKSLNVLVESNARAGAMGEHAPFDALVASAPLHYSLAENIDTRHFECHDTVYKLTTRDPGFEQLNWVVDDFIEKKCEEAEAHARQISDDSDNSVLQFDGYGTQWIKDIAQLSPDGYVQMALQLAWHKSQGNFTAVYETALTQMFIRGRTETIRSFSLESWLFVKAMTDPRCPTATRLHRLRDAVRAHNAYSRDAIKARGIDRHFLGLRLLMKDGEAAQLFQDPLFKRSETWKLSTSGLFQDARFVGTGFGSPCWDGYGVPYILSAEVMTFGIESKRSCPTTSTEGYKNALVESLREMRVLCEGETEVETNARL